MGVQMHAFQTRQFHHPASLLFVTEPASSQAVAYMEATINIVHAGRHNAIDQIKRR